LIGGHLFHFSENLFLEKGGVFRHLARLVDLWM